jgi:hypothetical protein
MLSSVVEIDEAKFCLLSFDVPARIIATCYLPTFSQFKKAHPTPSFSVMYVITFGGLTLSVPMSDLVRHFDFPVSDAFPHVVRTLANR